MQIQKTASSVHEEMSLYVLQAPVSHDQGLLYSIMTVTLFYQEKPAGFWGNMWKRGLKPKEQIHEVFI